MEEALDSFFNHQIVCKLFHFQTLNGFRHSKIDAYSAKFNLNFDQFMEVLQGEFGTIDTTEIKINVQALDDQSILMHFDAMIRFLRDLRINGEKLSAELATIRDQMIIDLQQLKYLFTFN